MKTLFILNQLPAQFHSDARFSKRFYMPACDNDLRHPSLLQFHPLKYRASALITLFRRPFHTKGQHRRSNNRVRRTLLAASLTWNPLTPPTDRMAETLPAALVLLSAWNAEIAALELVGLD